MKINTQNLLSTERKVILSHIMLEDSEKAAEIAKTLDGLKGDDRTVDVKLLYNGVEVNGKVIEDWLQYQVNHFQKQFEEHYSDVEKEIQRRVDKHKKDLEYNYRSDVIDKLNSVKETLNRIEIDLDCLDI